MGKSAGREDEVSAEGAVVVGDCDGEEEGVDDGEVELVNDASAVNEEDDEGEEEEGEEDSDDEGNRSLLGKIKYKPQDGKDTKDDEIQIRGCRGVNVSWEGPETNHKEENASKINTHRLSGLDLDLPIGYNFVPTDMELVEVYLIPKMLGEPQPAEFVHDADSQVIDHSSLDQLLDVQGVKGSESQKALYFFFRQKQHLGSKQAVDDENGSWRVTEDDKQVKRSDGRLYAYKRRMYYFKEQSEITGWKMDEYRLAEDFLMDNHIEGEQYVLARIRHEPQASSTSIPIGMPVDQENRDITHNGTQTKDPESQIRDINASDTNEEYKQKIKNLRHFRK